MGDDFFGFGDYVVRDGTFPDDIIQKLAVIDRFDKEELERHRGTHVLALCLDGGKSVHWHLVRKSKFDKDTWGKPAAAMAMPDARERILA